MRDFTSAEFRAECERRKSDPADVRELARRLMQAGTDRRLADLMLKPPPLPEWPEVFEPRRKT